jgi:hypothetical protein
MSEKSGQKIKLFSLKRGTTYYNIVIRTYKINEMTNEMPFYISHRKTG